MKISYFGVIASIAAFASLFLPWFTIQLWTVDLGSTMAFVANLFQLTGTVEGITKSIFLVVWFNAAAFFLMLATGIICLVFSTFVKRRRTLVFIVCCALALIAMIVFSYGLASSSFAVEDINPGYTISQFPEGVFELSPEESMQNTYYYSWAAGIGFWLALATAILALLATLVSRNRARKIESGE